MLVRIASVLALLGLTVAAPFWLRPEQERLANAKTERLIVISPHIESIRTEFETAFVRHMRENFQREVMIDWRQPGGTAEIALFLKSEFANAFGNHWKKETGLPFDIDARDGFTNPRVDPSGDDTAARARRLFLESGVGVGIDLFFGGGAYDFDKQAAAGALVARDLSGKYGPGALREAHPDWFSDAAIPSGASGEPFYDPDLRWVGAVLSAFGICHNTDSLARLGIEPPLERWEQLTDPAFFGEVAMADPSKSGSVTKAFEMIIQQQMREALDGGLPEEEAVAEGWDRAMRLLLKISANSRYFTDSAAKIPHDVAQGDAAAGLCIDFYGRAYTELLQHPDGSSRLQFRMPPGGTSIGADPIALVRGAPNPELAHRFIEFVLSLEGQRIWNYRAGEAGGPIRTALRRPPIRRDFYTAENRLHMADPDVNPYEIAKGFVYEPKWTGAMFYSLRFIIRCACVDTHPEQREAWRALIDAGFPPEATAEFEDIHDLIGYARASGDIASTLKEKDKIREVELARDLAGAFREKYRRVTSLCRR
ncbi:MAG: extracellular solute-binding protein [Verrucomicrobiae bacterium]|nr:extracellular solute-binding protein [Verrucomicrobiae bacterium]MCP5540909.1 extracellular solute-binding protein [Akkermansiaceae bacterium]